MPATVHYGCQAALCGDGTTSTAGKDFEERHEVLLVLLHAFGVEYVCEGVPPTQRGIHGNLLGEVGPVVRDGRETIGYSLH